jgi:hypothetical protein
LVLGNTGFSGLYALSAAFQAEYEGSIPFTRSKAHWGASAPPGLVRHRPAEHLRALSNRLYSFGPGG